MASSEPATIIRAAGHDPDLLRQMVSVAGDAASVEFVTITAARRQELAEEAARSVAGIALWMVGHRPGAVYLCHPHDRLTYADPGLDAVLRNQRPAAVFTATWHLSGDHATAWHRVVDALRRRLVPMPHHRGPSSFEEADAELARTLDSLDNASNYRNWLMAQFRPHLGSTILEVGAGHGTFTDALRGCGTVVAHDVSERCVESLQDRFRGVDSVRIVGGDLDEAVAGERFDSVVLVNVLEHVQDDDAMLDQLAAHLVDDGRLLLWVPAFDELYSKMDALLGHWRRYRRGPLVSQLLEHGYRVDSARYVNSIGSLAWWLVAVRAGRVPTSPGRVALYDKLVVPIISRIERRWSPPIGQSLLVVARRREYRPPGTASARATSL